MENAGVVEETMAWVKLSGFADGFNGVDVMASMASMALLVVLVASMASMDWRRSPMVNWGLRHRGH